MLTSRHIPCAAVLSIGLIASFSSPLITFAADTDVDLEWQENTESDLAGYRVYEGTKSGVYGAPDEVEKAHHHKSGLDPTKKHYFAVTAIDDSGNESNPSGEVSMPASTTTNTLSVSIVGNGKVSSNPTEIECTSSCDASFEQGQSVTLAAAPQTGSTFSQWTGACSGSGSCQVTMDSAKSVTATFLSESAGPPVPPLPVTRINFQPNSAQTPSGFLKDDGSAFNSTKGYGWSTSVSTRDRNRLKDQSLDTFIHFDQGTTATWQYNLANGDYLVSLASGDPSYPQGPHHVKVEGITAINNVTTAANKFITVPTFPVTVADGNLTVVLTRQSGKKTILNYLSITPVASNPVPPKDKQSISINFQPSGAPIPENFLKDDGSLYSSERGYGWNRAITHRTKDRNINSDQRLDTFIYSYKKSPLVTWAHDLPNGDYLITIASGDPEAKRGPHHISIEGQDVIQNVSTQKNEFLTITDFPVTVSDEQLSIDLETDGNHVMLNYVVITPMP
ncbi:MAG: InlB B-repeat-containing protein [Nitrospirales bacterium]